MDAIEMQPCDSTALHCKFDVCIDTFAPYKTAAKDVRTVCIAQSDRSPKQLSHDSEIDRNSTFVSETSTQTHGACA
jgi:hypothetical protein